MPSGNISKLLPSLDGGDGQCASAGHVLVLVVDDPPQLLPVGPPAGQTGDGLAAAGSGHTPAQPLVSAPPNPLCSPAYTVAALNPHFDLDQYISSEPTQSQER